MDAGEYLLNRSDLCPAGTWAEGTTGSPAFVYLSAPGTSKGFELDMTARPMQYLNINASLGYFNYETDVDEGDLGWMNPDYKIQPELSGTIGAQYSFHLSNGSVLMPRIDMFYQGEFNNGGVTTKPIDPYHVVPDYTVFNGRLTYLAPSSKWSVSLAATNLFDKFYWIALDPDRADDGETLTYDRAGVPSAPRMISLTFRRNF
jgi:iron complex outermembrane receptor protein